MSFFSSIINLLLPEYCIICNREGHTICGPCKELINLDSDLKSCILCENPTVNAQTHKFCLKQYPYLPSCFYYDYIYAGIVKKCIIKAKSTRKLKILLDILLQNTRFIDEIKTQNIDLIVPIPSSYNFTNNSRSNNTTNIASFFEGHLKVKTCPCLKKTITAKKQSKVNKDDRYKNAASSLIFDEYYKDIINGKTILIVDDVATTGSTLINSSKILHKYGAIKTIAYSVSYDLKVNK